MAENECEVTYETKNGAQRCNEEINELEGPAVGAFVVVVGAAELGAPQTASRAA